jgi:WhiB family redox-sensing transcriptional regulator
MKWRDSAACKGLEVGLFFPTHPSGVIKAKKHCAVCPVRTDCLDWALSHPVTEDRGVFGGTTHQERSAIRHNLKVYSTF